MKTHTITVSEDIPTLTGEAHIRKILFSKNTTEVTLDSLGQRIFVALGHSRKKVGIILTPGSEPEISHADMDRMEMALREPLVNMDMLFGSKWTVALFRATKERVTEAIGVRHTPEFLDIERRLDLLLEYHTRDSHTRERIAELWKQLNKEHTKSIHIWNEITRELLQTDTGRKIFRQLRPIYLERQRKREEDELSEFRSVDILFQRLLAEIQPTNIFIGSPEKWGRFEIYARHISKIAGDSNPKLAKPAQDISPMSVTVNLKTYTSSAIDFEV